MSRQALIVWVLLALALALISLAVWLKPGERTGAGDDALRRALVPIEPARVESIRVVRPGAGEAEVVERSEDGGWRLVLEPASDAGRGLPTARPWPLLPVRVRALLSTLTVERPDGLAGPGATLPAETITVEFRAGSATLATLRIDPTAVGGRCMAQLDGGPLVLAPESLAAVFVQPGPRGWRDTTALPVGGLEPARITLSSSAGELALTRVGPNWIARSQTRSVRADPAAVRAVLTSLASLSIERFIDDGRPDQAAYALGEPRLRIAAEADRRVVLPDGQVQLSTERRELLVGGPSSLRGDSFFATPGDGRTVFTIKSEPLRAISVDPALVAARTATARPPADVGMVIVTAGGAQRGFRREQVGWSAMTDAAPSPLPDPAPVEEVLSLVSERLATGVLFAPPPGWRAAGTIALMDFAGDPLERFEFGRLDDGSLGLRGLDNPAEAGGVWRLYAGDASLAPALLGLTPPG